MRVSVDSEGTQLYYIYMYPSAPNLPSLFFFFDVDHYFFLKSLLNWYIIASVFLLWLLGHKACGIVPPGPGMEPSPCGLEGEVLPLDPQGTACDELCLVAKSCPTFCNAMECECQPPLSMGILQTSILEWVAMPSPRGIFPTQGSNPRLLYCRRILYHFEPPGKPCRGAENRGETALNRDLGLLYCRQILCPLSHWGSPCGLY